MRIKVATPTRVTGSRVVTVKPGEVPDRLTRQILKRTAAIRKARAAKS